MEGDAVEGPVVCVSACDLLQVSSVSSLCK